MTSSALPVETALAVDLCERCGHAQTQPPERLDVYYDTEYNFRAGSTEEDDLYSSIAGKPVYRSEHQRDLVLDRYDLARPLRVLDFGCGKARTLQLLAAAGMQAEPYVFDVSDAYRAFWDAFVEREHQASFEVPAAWRDSMDLVLSFFALEHVEEPLGFLTLLRSLLRAGGALHVVVPNMYANVSDLVVADHINHFAAASLRRLFAEAGFASVAIDERAFRGAFVVDARVEGDRTDDAISDQRSAARQIADFWERLPVTVRAAEAGGHRHQRAAIYGSGVYGLSIAAALQARGRIAAFLDQNPFRAGLTLFDIPVIAPDAIGDDIEVIYVGLNPEHARAIIADVAALHRVHREFVYLA